MNRLPFLFVALVTTLTLAGQDVYVPPVPIGLRRDGQTRTPRPVPFPSEQQPWIRVRTPHFDVISSADSKRTEEIARNFETLAAALSRASSRFTTAATPTTVFVFAKRRDSQPYFDLLLDRDGSPATGLYVRHEDGGTMFIDAGKRIERTAMHELVHDLLRQGDLVPPLWIEEGLAELVGNATVQKGRIDVGEVIPEHTQLLRKVGARPVDEMLRLANSSEAASSSRFYAQSWASVQWLVQIGGTDTFIAFLRDVEQKLPIDDALQKHYRKTTKDLYQGSLNVSGRRMRLDVPEGFAFVTPEIVTLDRATLLYELGRFLTHVGGAEREPERHFREALRLDPRHARALAAVGDFEAAIAAAPEDAEVRLTYAESLLTLAIGPFAGVFEPKPGDEARFRKAREVLGVCALEITPLATGHQGGLANQLRRPCRLAPIDSPIAHGFIGTTYLVEADVAPGIAHLERAPERDDFMLNLYAMYLRAGDRAKAEALYTRLLANARDEQTRFAARNIRLIAETNRANELARKGDLDAAATVIRTLAESTTDATSRRELELEAAKLEATATINRHIRLYNDAIVLSNAGKKREALKVLESLLSVATDPAVLRDARKLQAELRNP